MISLSRLGAAAAIALVFVTAGCSETTGGSRNSDSGRSSASETPRRAATPGPNGDVRVIVFQPATRTRDGKDVAGLWMILVNENHSWRETEKGRYDIALQDPNRGYKVMTEDQTESLLKSLDNLGFNEAATPFVQGDEGYLTPAAASDRFRGVIYVETAKGRVKLLGQRPAGNTDVAGQRRYEQYVNYKTVVTTWFQSTVGELPVGGASPKPIRVESGK